MSYIRKCVKNMNMQRKNILKNSVLYASVILVGLTVNCASAVSQDDQVILSKNKSALLQDTINALPEEGVKITSIELIHKNKIAIKQDMSGPAHASLKQVSEAHIKENAESVKRMLKMHHAATISLVAGQVGFGCYMIYHLGKWVMAEPKSGEAVGSGLSQKEDKKSWGEWLSSSETWMNGATSLAEMGIKVVVGKQVEKLIKLVDHSHTIRWFACDSAHYVCNAENNSDGSKKKFLYSAIIKKLKKDAAIIEDNEGSDEARQRIFVSMVNVFVEDIEKIAGFVAYKRALIAADKRAYTYDIVEKLSAAGNELVDGVRVVLGAEVIAGKALSLLVEAVAQKVNEQIEHFEFLDDEKPLEFTLARGYKA